MTEESLALQRMNAAEDFPRNTCPAPGLQRASPRR